MNETNMPAAEVNSYEFAFHVLPTVAEGEVATVFANIKDIITKAGGAITVEEAPERFDLAYEIIKYLEGRNRKFTSAYFGWVRFTVEPEKIEEITAGLEGTKELLRHLLTKLTKVEEANPFFFHEALAEKKVENVEAEPAAAPAEEKAEETTEETAEAEDKTEEKPDGEEKSETV